MCEKMAGFEKYFPDEVRVFLKDQVPTLPEDVLQSIVAHKIDGEVFLEMNDEYLREIAPLLGDRLKIKRAIRTALIFISPVSYLYTVLYLKVKNANINVCLSFLCRLPLAALAHLLRLTMDLMR